MFLSSLLPGIRELRAPLAAGFIWMAFLYLVVGSPTRGDAPGPINDLLELSDSFGDVLTGVALSFIAYLIGSLSQDLFGQALPRGAARLARRFSSRDLMRIDFARLLSALRESIRALADAPEDERYKFFGDVGEGLGRTREALREAEQAGASQTEKPEALRPMIEAEEDLRVSIVPPLVALFGYLVAVDGLVWLVGLAFSLALYVQAAARHAQARFLAQQARQAQQFGAVATLLRNVEGALTDQDFSLAVREFSDVDLRSLDSAQSDPV